MKRMLKSAWKAISYLVLLIGVAGAVWGGILLWKVANQPPMGAISGIESFYRTDSMSPARCEYTAPDGTRYVVDTTGAVYQLSMRPEDSHSRLVFRSYADAVRYTRERGLASIPSTPMILATCSATDTECQTALELALDSHPVTGRRALLRQWFESVAKIRTAATDSARPACDTALTYLATALCLQGEQPTLPPGFTLPEPPNPTNDPPLGPWAATPELAPIWHRDRYLANGISANDDIHASAAAILALTFPNGWKTHDAIARVLHGKPMEPTFESLSAKLSGFSNNPTDPAAAAVVRQVLTVPDRPVVPAALAFASSPEQEILEPLGMRAWDDPMTALIAAVRDGTVSLAPGPDDGFYRHRWFALETLAAPAKAPECHKLQLSTDYERRWQRAFAAGFTEGRSGFIKRLPILTLGGSVAGPIPLDIAPRFTAEPSPIVYLRMSRAYRMLAEGIDRARESDYPGLSRITDSLRLKSARLLGLASIVYRETGHPIPLTEAESATDRPAAEKSATDWIANIEADPGIIGDARTVVPLADNGHGSLRCPAILGIRLEPVEYAWAEEPTVGENVDPTFVSTRLWLASPISATLTTHTAPDLTDFRKQCDAQTDVAALCRWFGQEPPRLVTASHRHWPWLVAGIFVLATGWAAWRWWRSRRWRTRLLAVAGISIALVGLGALAIFSPPLWLARVLVTSTATLPEGFRIASTMTLGKWTERWPRQTVRRLFFDLIRDPDLQNRYAGAMLPLMSENRDMLTNFTVEELRILRDAVNDPVPELGYAAWQILGNLPEEKAFLLDQAARTSNAANTYLRLRQLFDQYPSDPEVVAVALVLVRHADPSVRERAIFALSPRGSDRESLLETIRAATHDSSPLVRAAAARMLGNHGTRDDLDRLVALWQDPSARVRTQAFHSVKKRYDREKPHPISWKESRIQKALAQYALNPEASLPERLATSQWLTVPSQIREAARELLPMTDQLPCLRENPNLAPIKSSDGARAILVTNWLLADSTSSVEPPDAAKRNSQLGLQFQRHPALLTKLARTIIDNPEPAATLAVLRESAAPPGKDQTFARDLLERIETPPKREPPTTD
ncbi:MAG: HEAT repeat domain-containing protein [Verrucomicrobia bacterium]|nr:HEAT repeat domain-containing protein [Verrucomicrobiota bacterium]